MRPMIATPTAAGRRSIAHVYYFLYRKGARKYQRRWYFITRERGETQYSRLVLSLHAAVELARSAGFRHVYTPYGNLRLTRS